MGSAKKQEGILRNEAYLGKPGATPQEEQAIYKKCVYEAEAASQEGLTTEYSRKERVRKLRDMCFEANGMVRVKQEVEPAK